MVVPVELDEAARAAIDAARAQHDGTLLVAPRLDDRYASYGVIATIEQVGRLPAATRRRAQGRAPRRIGSGVTGPGAALWVEAEPVADPDDAPTASASSPRSTSSSWSPCCSGGRRGRSSTRSAG